MKNKKLNFISILNLERVLFSAILLINDQDIFYSNFFKLKLQNRKVVQTNINNNFKTIN